MESASAKELFVLGRVSSRPVHGHEIMRTLAESNADLWVELSEKHVYYILRKLERDGLVTSQEQLGEGRPARKVFAITPAGRTAFAQMMAAESLIESVPYSEFDVVFGMLAYTSALTAAEKTAILERRRASLRGLVARAQAASADAVRGDQDGLPRLVLDKVALVTQAELGWLDGVLLEIERTGWGSMRPNFIASGNPAAADAAPSDTTTTQGGRS